LANALFFGERVSHGLSVDTSGSQGTRNAECGMATACATRMVAPRRARTGRISTEGIWAACDAIRPGCAAKGGASCEWGKSAWTGRDRLVNGWRRRNANIPACARAANPGGCKPLQGDAPERIVLQGLEGSRPAPPLATDTLPQVGAGAGNVNTRRYASLDWPLKTLLDL